MDLTLTQKNSSTASSAATATDEPEAKVDGRLLRFN